MAIGDLLKGYEPALNVDDSGFEPIKYKGETVINVLRKEQGKFGERVNLELEIPTGSLKGRRLWKSYPTDKQDAVKRLADDLFTAGIPFDFSSDEAEQGTFLNAIGKSVYVRAFPFTPSKDMNGADIPEEDRKTKQACKIIKKPSDARVSVATPF